MLLVGRYITSRNRPEYGAVCGAFADAVRDLLVDWKLYVTTLEKDLKGNGEWNLIRIMSSCQQVVDPLYTTACAILAPCWVYSLLLCSLLIHVVAFCRLRQYLVYIYFAEAHIVFISGHCGYDRRFIFCMLLCHNVLGLL